jgi:hypothetical protein
VVLRARAWSTAANSTWLTATDCTRLAVKTGTRRLCWLNNFLANCHNSAKSNAGQVRSGRSRCSGRFRAGASGKCRLRPRGPPSPLGQLRPLSDRTEEAALETTKLPARQMSYREYTPETVRFRSTRLACDGFGFSVQIREFLGPGEAARVVGA